MTLFLFAALAVTAFMFGWVARRVVASRREADLQRNIYEAKGAVPQLESALRNRESRINTLTAEAQSLRDRLTQIETAASQKDAEIVKRDREIRTIRSELQILKDGEVEGDASLFGETAGDGEAAPSADAAQTLAMKKLEARYESLKKGLIQRDDKIAELEAQLAGGKGKATMVALELEREELQDARQELEAQLAAKDATIKDLQGRLTQESEQRELLETLAKRRADANRGLKDSAAKLEVQLPKMQEALKAREEIIASRDASIANLRGQLAQETSEKAAHAATITELQTTLAARRDELSRQAAQFESLKQQHAGQLEAQRQQGAAQLETVKQQNAATLEAARQKNAAQLDAARSKSRELEQRVAALTNDLTLAQRKIANVEAQLHERDGALGEQARLAQEADAKLREHGNTQNSLQGAVRDRDTTIASLRDEVARLQTDLARAQELARTPPPVESAPPADIDVPVPAAAPPAAASRSDDVTHPAEMQFAAIHEHAAATERELEEVMGQVKTLSMKVAELDAKRTSLETLLRDKDATLNERARRLEDQQDQLARLEARIDERNQEIAALKRAQQDRPSPPSYTTTH
jgi:septal ring factor EnvC (AmiA/AmiB activator)